MTRDRVFAPCEWRGRTLLLADTGGIEPKTDDQLLRQMRYQAELAIEQADVIVLVTDLQAGVTASDADVAAMLQKCGKPVVPVSYTHLDVYKRQLRYMVRNLYKVNGRLYKPAPVSYTHLLAEMEAGLNTGALSFGEVSRRLQEALSLIHI